MCDRSYRNCSQKFDGEIMDLIYCFCFVLFEALRPGPQFFSVILGRLAVFNQYEAMGLKCLAREPHLCIKYYRVRAFGCLRA